MTSMSDVREEFAQRLKYKDFVVDKTGAKTIEIIGASFVADWPNLFGEPNLDYIAREIEWYNSQSLYVSDIPGKTPAIWESVASTHGTINSNYGYLIYSEANHGQYRAVVDELKKNPDSRRAIMIYTRPTMHFEYNKDGMSDFVCTNTVQYLIRNGYINAVVNMRSNDVVYGFNNDRAWQYHVLTKLAIELGVKLGSIYWQAGSFHVYERHFFLVHNYHETGQLNISKEAFKERYGEVIF